MNISLKYILHCWKVFHNLYSITYFLFQYFINLLQSKRNIIDNLNTFYKHRNCILFSKSKKKNRFISSKMAWAVEKILLQRLLCCEFVIWNSSLFTITFNCWKRFLYYCMYWNVLYICMHICVNLKDIRKYI